MKMAKVIYELDMYEDACKINLFHNANDMYSALDQIFHIARNELKHGSIENDHVIMILENIKEISAEFI